MDDGKHDGEGQIALQVWVEIIVSERAKELAADLARWLKEALEEWGESLSEYPIPHIFTLILGAVLSVVFGWLF